MMTFVEDRPLNRIEINLLLAEAPDIEVRNLISYLKDVNEDAFNFFERNAMYKFGLIINQRPIYFAYITRVNGKNELWTVVNSHVKEQFSLYKYSKRSLRNALEQFNPIFATMEVHNKKNIEWVERMGFKRIQEDGKTITFKIEK